MRIGSLKKLVIIISACILFLAACGTSNETGGQADENGQSKSTNNLSIGTQPAGVTFHTLGSAFAAMISDHSDNNITVRPFSGPDAWMPLVNSGDVDFGTDTYFSVAYGFEGRHHFDPNTNIRTLVVGSQSPMAGIAVREDAGITKISDLKGKKVASQYSGNLGARVIMEAHLLSGGLTWDDVKGVPVTDNTSGLQALREGRVDAAFTGKPDNSIFLEVDNAIGIDGLNWGDITPEKFSEFPENLKEELNNLVPGLSPSVYDGGGFINADSMTISQFPLVVVVGAHVPDEVVYNVMETIWENHAEWEGTMIQSWSPELLGSNLNPPAPFHEGVVQFFKDKGVWTEEAEQKHQELLSKVQ
ncbi:TAXI family TRAP transporter solute-binding subunit [Bacillus sp. Marseille-P3661]|uniref:TAXI family TRAP transporter solute-binding subunit n=1 Tax=Bacillus sp. Marseille-P3661 TaxID=1936234 RepID=UPI000C84003B|nr:TAXI family TRAP transporter solute-binding subunit [Bacillus sp. Marseille-P3661]